MSGLDYKVIEPRFQDTLGDTFDRFTQELQVGVASTQKQLDAGRGRARIFALPSGEQIVVRQFMRGGWVKAFSTATYLRNPFSRIGTERPFVELAILRALFKKGISVPEPVAAGVAASATRVCYQGFIATVFIPESSNLLTLVNNQKANTSAKDDIRRLCFLAGQEASKMISAGVYHPDLHLGNVLCKNGNGAVLIDFDRAMLLPGVNRQELQTRILGRWIRSSKKHGVSGTVDAPFEEGLLSEAA